MNYFERACREWLRGCSCAPDGEPWKCQECTRSFYEHLASLAYAKRPCPSCGGRGVIHGDEMETAECERCHLKLPVAHWELPRSPPIIGISEGT